MQGPATDQHIETGMIWVENHAACGLLLPFPMLFKIVTQRKARKINSFGLFFEQGKFNVKKH